LNDVESEAGVEDPPGSAKSSETAISQQESAGSEHPVNVPQVEGAPEQKLKASTSLRRVLRKLSGSSITPPHCSRESSGKPHHSMECFQDMDDLLVSQGSALKVHFAASRDGSQSSFTPTTITEEKLKVLGAKERGPSWTLPRRLSSSSLAFTYQYATKAEGSCCSEQEELVGPSHVRRNAAVQASCAKLEGIQIVEPSKTRLMTSASLEKMTEKPVGSNGSIVFATNNENIAVNSEMDAMRHANQHPMMKKLPVGAVKRSSEANVGGAVHSSTTSPLYNSQTGSE
jgi:hypothetical protein